MEENEDLPSNIIKKDKYLKELYTFVVIPVIYIIIMILVFNKSVDIWYYLKPKVVIFTMILIMIIHSLLILVTGSSKRSVIIQSVLLWILLFINKLRYTYTYEPITFSDFVYSTNAGEIFSLLKNDILEILWKMIPLFSCLAVILAILIFITNKINYIPKGNKKKRIFKAVIPLFILIILFAPFKFIKEFMFKYVYDKYSQKDYAHNSSNAQYYSEYTILRRNVCRSFRK